MNQISLARLMMDMSMRKRDEVDENMVRHMILNSVRLYRTQFNKEYDEVVLTYDSRHYWRRDFFPQYKSNRKKNRDADSKDWNAIFEILNKIKAEIKDNLPYKFLEVYGAEADDIIATLFKFSQTEKDRSKNEKIIIVSGDKDFIPISVVFFSTLFTTCFVVRKVFSSPIVFGVISKNNFSILFIKLCSI